MKMKILLGLIILIFLVSNVNAFGVASPFAGSGPIVVLPGETKDLDFLIQNGAGATEDVITKIEIISGYGIIEIVDKNEYLVPAGGETTAKIRIKVPEYARGDDTWNIKLKFGATPSSKEGAINMGYGVITSFDVITVAPSPPVVVEEMPIVVETAAPVVKRGVAERTTSSNLPLALVFIVIAGIVIYYIQKNKPKTKKK